MYFKRGMRPIASSGYTYIRLEMPASGLSSGICIIKDIIMASSPSGNTLCSGGTVAVSSGAEYSGSAFRTLGETVPGPGYWNSAATPDPQWIQYHFTSGVTLYEVRAYPYPAYAIYAGTIWNVKGSNNGSTWSLIKAFPSVAWVENNQQVFVL